MVQNLQGGRIYGEQIKWIQNRSREIRKNEEIREMGTMELGKRETRMGFSF